MQDGMACRNCQWWRKDYGTFTATGWTGGMADNGHCHFNPKRISMLGSGFCHNWNDGTIEEEPVISEPMMMPPPPPPPLEPPPELVESSDMTLDISFKKMIQDCQTYESFDADDDHMVSRIFFDLDFAGRQYLNMKVEVSQPYGTRYETEPLEVGRPEGAYNGPWNHNVFSEHCERYYRRQVGRTGRGIRIAAGREVRMRDNEFSCGQQVTIELPKGRSGAW